MDSEESNSPTKVDYENKSPEKQIFECVEEQFTDYSTSNHWKIDNNLYDLDDLVGDIE